MATARVVGQHQLRNAVLAAVGMQEGHAHWNDNASHNENGTCFPCAFPLSSQACGLHYLDESLAAQNFATVFPATTVPFTRSWTV